MAVFHKQCLMCHAIAEGPAKGQNLGHEVFHISDTGDSMQVETDAEHPFNVSHGICDSPQCAADYEATWRPAYEQRKREREAARAAEQRETEQREREERRQQRRMRRGRKDKQ